MERESKGTGTSVFMLNNRGAADHANSAAADTLKSILENDFDPVPCPACGHYQRYMFPKLQESKGLLGLAVKLGMILVALLTTIGALQSSVAYVQGPDDHTFWNMVAAWSVSLPVCLIGLGLLIVQQRNIRRFDPNLRDQQERIAIGRSRAVTRAEFEKFQKENKNG
jgi:hypothetical protein